ncbi:MAG: ABC transporter permease subunit [Nocardioidaceae bacterium]
MSADIARLDLRLRRRSTLGYVLGLLCYAALIVVLYPAFEHDASLNQLTTDNATMSALLGATGSLTSPEGWMSANLYANFVPLFALFMTLGYGAAAVAGQDEDGTLGGLVALPVDRGRLLGEKLVALAVLSLPIAVATLAADLLGPAFDLHLGTGPLIGTTIGVALMAFDFGLVALVVGAWTGRRGTALGVAVTVAAVSYVIGSLAPVVHWIHPLRFLSLFYWSVGNQQLTEGLHPGAAVLLCAVGAALLLTGLHGFRRLDIH